MTVISPYTQHIRKILTASEWASLDPVLPIGVIGVESDTGQAKFGDGSSVFSLLPYATYPGPGYEVFTTAEKEKLGSLSNPQPESFPFTAGCYLFDPLDSTTYYWGSLQSRLPKTSALYFKIGNPADYPIWIRSVAIEAHAEGTLGTTETSTLYIRVDNTTDYPITDQIKLSAVLSTYKITGLNIELGADSYFEFKWVTPAWATNPTQVQFSATVYADTAGSGVTALAVSTLTADTVGETTATINGNLTGLGGASSVDVSLEWGLTDAYGNTTTPEAKTTAGLFHAHLTELPAETLHHFRAKATDGTITVYGSDFTFTTGTEPTPPSLYGTMAYTGSDPIGGGAGYTSIITAPSPDDADHRITTADTIATFLTKLAACTTGQILYVNPDVNLNFYAATPVSGTNYNISIPAGVTVASNRGSGGSAGGRLYTTTIDANYRYFFTTGGDHVRITGLRIQGPYYGTLNTSYWGAILESADHGLIVDNCEIYNWPYSAIGLYSDGAAGSGGANFSSVDWDKAGLIKYNYIHDVRSGNYGYGVQLGSANLASGGASAYIKGNLFNNCRHFVSGERNGKWSPACDTEGSWLYSPTNGQEIYIKAHYNVFGYGIDPLCSNTQFDQHGGSDTCLGGWGTLPNYMGSAVCWAGGEIEVKWNDFLVPSQGVCNIRGIPRYSWTFTYNYVKQGTGGLTPPSNYKSLIYQRLFTIPGYADADAYVATAGEEILVSNNWWHATEPPPES